jgi:hypothetical protein
MTLNKNPQHSIKVADAAASASATELSFSSDGAPSAKLTLNINAFNGNKTNFGGNRNGNK